MKNAKSVFAVVLLFLILFFPNEIKAEQVYSFGNVSFNYLDWSAQSQNEAKRKDFSFLELEGGASYSWGDVYGFIDYENPLDSEWKKDQKSSESASQFRVVTKGSIAVNLGQTNWNLYSHLYSFADSSGFSEQNTVLGFSYDLNLSSGLWIKPFLGIHHVQNNFIGAGFNGYMGGWVLGYDFESFGQKFAITNWNEIEFSRSSQYEASNGDTGLNGAISLWWKATERITSGVQYRYANQKLGSKTYQDAFIYTIKFGF